MSSNVVKMTHIVPNLKTPLVLRILKCTVASIVSFETPAVARCHAKHRLEEPHQETAMCYSNYGFIRMVLSDGG
jgi:hypothetical protein